LHWKSKIGQFLRIDSLTYPIPEGFKLLSIGL
jgi:hypothetical protein